MWHSSLTRVNTEVSTLFHKDVRGHQTRMRPSIETTQAEHPPHHVVRGVSATFGFYPNSSTCSWNAVAISACAQNRW